MTGIAVWVLSERLQAIDFGDVLSQLRAQPLPTVFTALACSTGVYALVGFYEGIGVRLATTRRMVALPFRTAIIANPIARAIGFALVSGGAIRYRMYAPAGLSAGQVAAVILLVAMPYLLGVGWLIDLSLLFNTEVASKALRLSTGLVMTLGVIGLMKDIGWLVFVSVRKTPIVLRDQSTRLPSLRDTAIQIAVGLMQISLMTLILYLFMPPELGMSWPAFVAIYCIGYVAGQLSNMPAGLGVLEAALLLMLPHVPPAKLLGAIIAYRAVYELLPLIVALSLLAIFESTHPAGVIRRKVLRSR